MLRNLTIALIVSTFALWIGWDVYLAKHGGPTESMLIRDAGKVSTLWAHMLGVLIGHWLFPRQHVFVYGWVWVLPIWVTLGAFDLAYHYWGTGPAVYRFEGFWFLCGLVCGTLLWCQADRLSPLP